MNLLTGKKGMLNPQSVMEASKGKVIYVDINEIQNNPLNKYEVKDIDDLAENIAENGLLQPLQGLQVEDGIVLLSGHRRLAAVRKLLSEGKTIKYAGKDLDDELPMILLYEEDPLEQRALLLAFNAYRTMNKDEKVRVIKEADKVYASLVKQNKRPKGREREWITAVTGISDGTVGKTLADLNRSEDPASFEEKDEKSAAVTKSVNETKKVIKSFRNAVDSIAVAKELIAEGMDPVDYKELKDLIKGLQADLKRVIPELPVYKNADYTRIYLNWNDDIRTFAERGDVESVEVLLTEKNKSCTSGHRDKYDWSLKSGKFHFRDDSGFEVDIPLKRFSRMLIDKAKSYLG